MKFVRPLLLGLGVLAILLAVSVAVAFTSAFQTWAARRALAARPDLTGTVESVSAGLKRVEVRNVRIERNGAVLTLPSATAELPLIDAGLNEKVAIQRLVAKGWVLDLTRAAPPASKPAVKTVSRREFSLLSSAIAAEPVAPVTMTAAVFQGIFPRLQLPVDLSVDAVELEGEIILPPMQGQPSAHVKVVVTGGGLGAGRQGSFTYELAANSGAGVAPISAHGLRGAITATMDTPRSFTRLATKAEASVSGTQFPRGVKLNVEAVAAREAAKENYALILADGDKQIATLQAGFPLERNPRAKAGNLEGTWKLNLRNSDLTPFLLGVALPVFEIVGDGGFATDVALAEARTSGKIDATANQLGNFRPELASVGSVRLTAEFGLARRGDVIRVEQLTADLAAGKPVGSVRALQPFEFNPKTRELAANPTQDLFALVLQGVPLTWAQPWLEGFTVTGGDLRGEFVASAGNEGLVLRPKSPLAVDQLSVRQGDRPLLERVDLALTASADYAPQGWQAVISSLTAKSGAAPIVTMEAKVGQLAGADRPIKATGKLSVNLPAALAQPAATGALRLANGTATLDFSTSLGAKQELQAQLALSDLGIDPRISPEKLPGLTTELRADREASGKITLNLPVVVERGGRRSDLNITGSVAPDKTGYVVDAHLTSEQLVLDDLKAFVAPLFPATNDAASEKNPPRDTAPPWEGISGQLTLALKKVVYSPEFQVADVGGTLRIEAGSVKVVNLRAGTGGEGEIKLSGGVLFNSKVMEPYSLQAQLDLENFESVPLFRALDPGKPATVEGRFNVASRLNGTGANLAVLVAQTKGDFQLVSKSGIFRGLRSDTAEAIKAAPSTLSGIVTGIGSLLGKDIAEKAEKLGSDINKRGKVVSDIATTLAEIPYDQLSVSLVRDASLNVELKDFTLISPEVRLGGVGLVTYQREVPLLTQPLDLRLQLGARGKLADLMKRGSLLGEAQDSLGYFAFSLPIHVGGSLANPDLSDLKRELLKVALGR
jgi:hypothetical protein